MKRNKSQILFFFLCLILGALLLLFLYKNREAEHEKTAQLVQEAASSIAAVTDGSGDAAESTAVSSAAAAAETQETDTAETAAAPEAAEPAAAEEPAAEETAAEPTAAPADPEAAATASDDTAIAALAAGAPQIRLNTHAVTLPIGSTFSYMQYIGSLTDDKDNYHELARRVELSGSVNTAAAGTYAITYTVRDTDGNASNQPTLTVTVQ